MCDDARAAGVRSPHWGRLYAVAALAGLGLVVVHVVPLASGLAFVLRAGLLVAGFGAMAWWLRANRVALDQVEWCTCASRTVAARVVRSTPAVARAGRKRPRELARPHRGRDDRQRAGR